MAKDSVSMNPEGDENVDGCDVKIENPTADEDLPASEGGVA